MGLSQKDLARFFFLLIFLSDLATAAPRIPTHCRSLLKKAFSVVKSDEKNPTDLLNQGWTAKDIAELAFPNLDEFQIIKPKQTFERGESLASLLELQRSNREITDLLIKHHKEGHYNAKEISPISEKVHHQLETYLSGLGVELLNHDVGENGQRFTLVSTNGKHPLNRWARTLFFERNFHIIFYGNSMQVVDDLIQIPPSLFNRPNPMINILSFISKFFVSSYKTPIAYLDFDTETGLKMQDAKGSWRLLDWDDLLNQDVRVNFRAPKSDEDSLYKAHQVLQRIHSLKGYLSQFRHEMRESVRKSIRHYASYDENLIYVAIQRNGEWIDLWDKGFSPPLLENLKNYKQYINYVLKNDTFKKHFQFEEEINFYVVMVSPYSSPVNIADLQAFSQIERQIQRSTSTLRGPKISVSTVKISTHNGAIIGFEPIPIELDLD